MKRILNLLLLTIVLSSCGNPEVNNADNEETTQEAIRYYMVSKNIELLIQPSASSKKLINEKASSITKSTEYCGLDKSNKLIILEVSGEYSKVKVIEPEWLTDTYIGWVPSKNLVEFGTLIPAKGVPSKLDAFNDVDVLIANLSQNGIGSMGSWRLDDLGGYISITDYYRFGQASPVNGLENNLAYYLESENEGYAKKLTVVLNIFNKSERREGLSKYKTIIEMTFKSLKLAVPTGLNSALNSPKAYVYSDEVFRVSLDKEKNNIESWKLSIIGL